MNIIPKASNVVILKNEVIELEIVFSNEYVIVKSNNKGKIEYPVYVGKKTPNIFTFDDRVKFYPIKDKKPKNKYLKN